MENRLIEGPLPTKASKRVDVISITSPSPTTFTILSEKVYGSFYHWVNNRSRQCRRFAGDCEFCATNQPEKWSGYIHCVRWGDNAEVFVELSITASNMLTTLANKRETLRGSIVKLSKTKGGLRGRYVVDMLERLADQDALPPWSTPDALLRKLWNSKL